MKINKPTKVQQTIMKASAGRHTCLVDSEQATIAAVAHWYVYSPSSIPLATLENTYFLEMLKEQHMCAASLLVTP